MTVMTVRDLLFDRFNCGIRGYLARAAAWPRGIDIRRPGRGCQAGGAGRAGAGAAGGDGDWAVEIRMVESAV